MNGNPNNSAETATHKVIRPVLIASEQTASEYPVFLQNLLIGLGDESITSTLVYPSGWDMEFVVSPSAEIIRHPAVNLPLMGYKNREILAEKLEKYKPTVLHCLCQSESRLTKYLSQHFNVPYILTVNSLQKRRGRLAVSLKRCARIIVPAETIKQNLVRLYPKYSERIERVNIGSFVGEKTVCFDKPSFVRSIVTVGPWASLEQFRKFLAAAKRLSIEGYEFMMVVMSESRDEEGITRLLSETGLSEVAVNVPKLRPWRSVLAGGDIFVQPGPAKSFDSLVLEAMSAGVAVAGCKGGVDDLVIDGQTSAVFDPENELNIFEILKKLFDHPDLARQLAAGAQEYLRKNHRVSDMIASVLRIYRQVQEQFGAKTFQSSRP